MVHQWPGIQSINPPVVCISKWNLENFRSGSGELEGEKLKNQKKNLWNNEKNKPHDKLNSVIALVSAFKPVQSNHINIIDMQSSASFSEPPCPPSGLLM